MDIDETVFRDHLATTFDSYDAVDHVETEVYLDDLDRYVDIVVQLNQLRIAIEVEDTAESVIDVGVGQALMYANALDAVPCVVYPATDDECRPEIMTQRSQVPIIAVPVDWDGCLDTVESFDGTA